MRDKVWKQFGVWLEYEMEILGVASKEENELIHESRENIYKKSLLQDLRKGFLEKTKNGVKR